LALADLAQCHCYQRQFDQVQLDWMSLCQFCREHETTSHVFLDVLQPNLSGALLQQPLAPLLVLGTFPNFVPASRNTQIAGLAAICWAIWKLRNKAYFKNKLIHSPFELISYAVVFMNYWAGLYGEKDAADIQAGADNLMRLASTGGNAETGNSSPDPPLRLENKKPDDDKETRDIA
jgi:hypothetical protein